MIPKALFILLLVIIVKAENDSPPLIVYEPDIEVEVNPPEPNSYIFIVGDFNGDGKDDYLRQKIGDWADEGDSSVELFTAQSNDQFESTVLSSEFDLRTNYINLYVGDFNGDGYDDILRQEKGDWATDDANTAYLLLSNGDGDFTKYVLPEDFKLKGDYTNLYIGDFNGDGKDDIFRQPKGDWGSENACVLFAVDDNTNFFQPVDLPADYALNGDLTNLYVANFNGDGCDDILRQEKGAYATDRVNTANILIASENGTFDKIVLSEDYNLSGDLTILSVADFSGDGKADILRREKDASASGDAGAQLLIYNDNGEFEQITLSEDFDLNGDNIDVYVGDFNADKKYDFLRQITGDIYDYESNPRTKIFMSTGDNFEGYPFIDEKNDLEGTFYVGDFNGDKRDDLLRYVDVDNIQVFYSNGDGSYIV